MNIRLILITLLAFLGYSLEPQPARLGKKLTLREKINCWVYIHRYELLLLITVMMMIVFALVVFLAIGSATESGNMYNHIQDVV